MLYANIMSEGGGRGALSPPSHAISNDKNCGVRRKNDSTPTSDRRWRGEKEVEGPE